MLPKIQIKSDGKTGKVFIDGIDMTNGLQSYYLEHEAGNLPVLRLNIIATNIDIETSCIPELPDVYKAFYERKKN